MLPTDPGRSARVLVALAVIGESPIQISEGKVSSVPPPATALIIPPSAAAPNITSP
jgi:hypothetical protein